MPYGTGKFIPYDNIAKILTNMINDPAKYNKKNVPTERLTGLLTAINESKTQTDATNILNSAIGIAAVVGQGVSKQY